MEWFRRLSFRKKILTSYILFIGLAFLLSGVYCIRSIRTSRQETIRYMHQFAEQVNLNMEVIFSNMDRVRFIHLIDDKVKPMIRTKTDEKSLTKALEDDDYVTRALNHMTNMNQYVLRATFVNEYGDVYSNIKTENSSYLDRMYNIQRRQDWEDRHNIYYTGVYHETINMVEYPLITSISKIYDIDQDRPIGTLYIDLNFSAVRQILDQTLESASTGTHLMIFDHKGELIYHTGENEDVWGNIQNSEKQEIIELVKTDETDISNDCEIRLNGKEAAVTLMDSQTTGWRVLVYTPLSDIYAAGIKNIAGLAAMMGIVLITAMFLGVILSGQISRPVSILIKAMEKVDKGTVKYIDEKEYDWQDEMGMLLHSYNQMGQRINESIEKIYVYQLNQKQTELKMLQFQINPHFLYNTLDAISAMALVDDGDNCFKMTRALAMFYRDTLSNGRSLVKVNDEINCIRNYMTIINMRSDSEIKMEYDVDSELQDEPMVKLLLQPFVENSVQHGLRGKADGRIRISIHKEQELISIVISDNGKGMTEQKVNTIMSEEKNGEKGGFGVYSAVQRIRLFYGIENPISIHSVKDQGTNVKILIRRIEEGIEDGDQGVDRR